MRARYALLFWAILTGPVAAQTVAELVATSVTLEAAGRPKDALAVLLQAEKLDPTNAGALWRAARQYDQLAVAALTEPEKKQFNAKALDAAQRAVRAGPKDSQAHLYLAIVYGRMATSESPRKKIELSKLIREEAEIAAQLDPKNDVAWFILGRWNYEMANFNPFLKGLAQAIYGKFPDASNEKAAACFEKAIAASPARPDYHIEYGRTLAALGKKNEARKQLEKGLLLPSNSKDDEETMQRARQALQELK